MTNLRFPEEFLWGTATSAHQVEGGNWNSDWWEWEHTPGSPCTEPSGDACDHWHRYPDDLRLLADLGFNAYRFSVEWARIEPEEGWFSRATLDHYRRVLGTCRELGLTPVVTFHHFTSPRWLARDGAWENPAVVDRFARYCERTAAHLGDLMGMACTINEPNVVALYGYRVGVFPPGRAETDARARATDHFIAGHRRAVEAIGAAAPGVPVGLALAMTEWEAEPGGEERLARYRRKMEDVYLEAVAGDDFIGVQTYTRERVGPEGHLAPPAGARTTLMGYEFRPEALEATIRRAAEVTGIPVLVTENGIATENDAERVEYVARALGGVHRCLADGVDVRGYFYWTLLDNFEWLFGYRPTFGLVAVDRETLERAVKSSARWLGEVARRGLLEPEPHYPPIGG